MKEFLLMVLEVGITLQWMKQLRSCMFLMEML